MKPIRIYSKRCQHQTEKSRRKKVYISVVYLKKMDNVEECGFISSILTALLAIAAKSQNSVRIPNASPAIFSGTETQHMMSMPAGNRDLSRHADVNANGYLSMDEIVSYLEYKIGAQHDLKPYIDEKGMEMIIKAVVDTDGDNRVSTLENGRPLLLNSFVIEKIEKKDQVKYEIRHKSLPENIPDTMVKNQLLAIIGGISVFLVTIGGAIIYTDLKNQQDYIAWKKQQRKKRGFKQPKQTLRL